jgi:hypothetical protein
MKVEVEENHLYFLSEITECNNGIRSSDIIKESESCIRQSLLLKLLKRILFTLYEY